MGFNTLVLRYLNLTITFNIIIGVNSINEKFIIFIVNNG